MVRDFARVDASATDFNAFLAEFQRETDRAAAVLAAAYLDTQLERLLKATLIGTNAQVTKLVRQNGPLGTFSGRIRICMATGLISSEVATDLDRVRAIRNDFAHRIHGITFTTQSVADRCEHFAIVRLYATRGRVPERWLENARHQFNLAVTLLSFYLRKLTIAPVHFVLQHPLEFPLDEIHRDHAPDT